MNPVKSYAEYLAQRSAEASFQRRHIHVRLTTRGIESDMQSCLREAQADYAAVQAARAAAKTAYETYTAAHLALVAADPSASRLAAR